VKHASARHGASALPSKDGFEPRPRDRDSRLVCETSAPKSPCQLDPRPEAKADGIVGGSGDRRGGRKQPAVQSAKADSDAGRTPATARITAAGSTNMDGADRTERGAPLRWVSGSRDGRDLPAGTMAKATAHRAPSARPSAARSTGPKVKPARAGATQNWYGTVKAVAKPATALRYEPFPPAPDDCHAQKASHDTAQEFGSGCVHTPRDPVRQTCAGPSTRSGAGGFDGHTASVDDSATGS
jgi:hypothetical protein